MAFKIPKKLRQGDQIRVIAPSRSLSIVSRQNRDAAVRRLEELGFKVTFGRHVEETDRFLSSAIESRLADLHEAFADRKVAGILTAIGGFNSNQLLDAIDFDLLRRRPKVFCGYSDITALQNAILRRSGFVTYSGPHFSTFAMKQGLEYTIDHFWKCVVGKAAFDFASSDRWSDDPWWRDQNRRVFEQNPGPVVLQQGDGEGHLVGGNLGTLSLLFGTRYMPSLKGAVLMLEDDEQSGASTEVEFARHLRSLLQQSGARHVRGLLIGRFQRASQVSLEGIAQIISTERGLRGKPVVCNMDFGHTFPMITFPIGGKARLSAQNDGLNLRLLSH